VAAIARKNRDGFDSGAEVRMAQYKTPGVYPVELSAFPNSVVEVATAVPAFIGYTEWAARGSQSLKNIPTRLSSMAEFGKLFGGPPQLQFDLITVDPALIPAPATTTQFLLYYSLRMFFDNGGGVCWIVSVGGYGTADNPTVKSQDDFADPVWIALAKEQEPTMIVVPDAVLLPQPDYVTVAQRALAECATLTSRIAILDVYNGNLERTWDDSDVISGTSGFRNVVENDHMSYGVAYYPWLNTNVISASNVSYANLTSAGADALHKAVVAKLKADAATDLQLSAKLAAITVIVDKITAPDDKTKTASEILLAQTKTHQALLTVSDVYQDVMTDLLQAMNVMPPSGAMAGVYTRTDSSFGVFKAPANTGVTGAMSPTVNISHDEQEDLNVPLDGKAINAIRAFVGRGVLVWGARTLDGNSQDWRYVNVRRTLIMLEQSISIAAQAYVFAPNDAGTWLTLRTMIENFLNNQWKSGALAGAKPEDAYDVSVGLGSTMTGNDILDGIMRVMVKVAIVRPAEFIIITFQQKMQTS
jgi:uncharacterized protein